MVRESSAIRAVESLSTLDSGWDSYEGNKIHDDARKVARDFLSGFEREGRPSPIVGPTSDGGVVLVWRVKQGPSLQVFFSAAGGRYIVTQNQQLLEQGRVGEADAFAQDVFKRVFSPRSESL